MKLLYNLLFIILLASTSLLISCSGTSAQLALDKAESLMETNPDSSLAIISAIDTDALTGKRIKARYSLLKSMALDKNYVCLYALGLRGKEIGEYIQSKRHYHTSTDIRKKLGLQEGATNLGLHIRNLMIRS